MTKRIIVKVGSLAVTSLNGGIDPTKISKIMFDLNQLIQLGHEVILVTSGAINTGKKYLPSERKEDCSELVWQQVKAAIGQPQLMHHYAMEAAKFGHLVAQILVTHDDFKNKNRFLNIRNMMNELLHQKIIPIVNENDTVATEEISIGDNDQLAAAVAQAMQVDLLILLTEADGLFDRDPKHSDAKKISLVTDLAVLKKIKFGAKTSVGRGGMETKLAAISKLLPLGIDVVLATFFDAHPVFHAWERKNGTYFKAQKKVAENSKKLWMVALAKTSHKIVIDKGAWQALQNNASLLAVGVKKILGKFKRGDIIAIYFNDEVVGYGMVEYDARELEIIHGKKTSEIELVANFGNFKHHGLVVHKDNLCLI